MSKQKNKLAGLQKRKAISGYLFISPFIIGFLVFMVKPLFESCYMSFCEVNLAAGNVTKTLNGITNYIFAFRVDPEYNRLLWEEITRMMVYSLGVEFYSNFSFRCNASTLTDALKYDKRSSYSNAVQWY